LQQDGVELEGRGEVAAERFFYDDASAARAVGFSKLLDDGAEHDGRYREIVRRMLG